MTKLEMWEVVYKDDPKTIKEGQFELEELFDKLTWNETHKIYVVLNWFRVHDKHKFKQFRSLIFYAGDVRDCYNFILARYYRELKVRGKH